MITLYGFGPRMGLPDASPFVMKAEVLLKMAGLPYRIDTSGFRKAPKGKLPYIEDEGKLVADSTFIRFHIEEKYGFDFDKVLTVEQRGIAWATEKLMEEHLYYSLKHALWMEEGNFRSGPAAFFNNIPLPLRPIVKYAYRRSVRNALRSQGMGRHGKEEIERLGMRAVDALAAVIGEKPYLMGDVPCGADACVLAFTAGMLHWNFESPIRSHMRKQKNLINYEARMIAEYYPGFRAVA